MTTTRFLDRAGGRIAYDDTDDTANDRRDRAIIAVPGIGDRRQSYRHVLAGLDAAGHRVVTMDLRGMGESSAAWPGPDAYSDPAIASDVVALIDALGIERAVVMGNSLGAAAAVLAAATSPAVRGLVLIGPFVRPVPLPWWQKAAFAALLAPPWGRRAWVGYYRSKMYPGPKPPDLDDYVARLSAMLAEPGRMRALRALARNTHAESGARLGDLHVPALVVMGTADPDFPDPRAEAEAVAAATGGDVLLVEGSGHYPQADQPTLVVTAVHALATRALNDA